MIFKNIYLNKFFLLFLLIIILTGNFNYFFPYFLLLFIHEMGHAITGLIMGYQVKKIIFYPLGGLTILELPVNIPLLKEFLITIMGPIFQISAYIFLKHFFPFIKSYHYTLLIFNLLPLYPLDGGKLFNIGCCYFYNFLVSFNITFIISLFIILILCISNIHYFNLNLFLMVLLMFVKLIRIYQKRFIYYHRLLLERYLYRYQFRKIKNINGINCFYRDCYHYIGFNCEEYLLKNYFKIK